MMKPMLTPLLALLLPSAAALAANPAIDTSVPCNSGQIAFMPMRDDAVEYVRKLPGAGPVASQGDGTYIADFGSPDAVNALLADLNARHADEVIDRFQFLQCKYRLFAPK
ncbi:MAG TPA: hypothetical protein VGD08_13270 [Stellaceae bacterium]